MTELKTQPTDVDPEDHIAAITHTGKREDARQLLALFRAVTGQAPVMWGTRIVGYGRYDYRTDAGQNGSWPRTGFAVAKSQLTLYIMLGFSGYGEQLEKLGKFRTGKSCLYINKLSDVDSGILVQLLETHYRDMAQKYPAGVI